MLDFILITCLFSFKQWFLSLSKHEIPLGNLRVSSPEFLIHMSEMGPNKLVDEADAANSGPFFEAHCPKELAS